MTTHSWQSGSLKYSIDCQKKFSADIIKYIDQQSSHITTVGSLPVERAIIYDKFYRARNKHRLQINTFVSVTNFFIILYSNFARY